MTKWPTAEEPTCIGSTQSSHCTSNATPQNAGIVTSNGLRIRVGP